MNVTGPCRKPWCHDVGRSAREHSYIGMVHKCTSHPAAVAGTATVTKVLALALSGCIKAFTEDPAVILVVYIEDSDGAVI